MAVILDAMKMNRRRFAVFAKEYLDIPPEFFVDGVIRNVHCENVIISYLIDKGVFTVDELMAEFKIKKIYISEKRLLKIAKGEGK